jgi:hypothetical protein
MRCHHCQGPFGMARQQLLTVRRLLNFRGYLNFCSQRCLDDFRKQEKACPVDSGDGHDGSGCRLEGC